MEKEDFSNQTLAMEDLAFALRDIGTISESGAGKEERRRGGA